MTETIVVNALRIIAAAAPGVLAAITGKESDELAIEAARAEVAKINPRPAGSALDAYADRVLK